ncbi:hypothetical protein ABZ958_07675 [Streptomyces sp. NPDC046237]|uniref:hypothetical protein n=1 Tax=Streptomyces sp. NPDC046237 TaxID=3154914 RepID=UPI0033D96010
MDTQALRLGPVPVSVAATVFTVAGWLLSLTGSVLLDRADPARSLSSLPSLLSLAVLALAAVASWWVTRRLVPPLTKLFPDEPGPSGQDFGGLPDPLEGHRSAVAGRRRATVRLRRRR